MTIDVSGLAASIRNRGEKAVVARRVGEIHARWTVSPEREPLFEWGHGEGVKWARTFAGPDELAGALWLAEHGVPRDGVMPANAAAAMESFGAFLRAADLGFGAQTPCGFMAGMLCAAGQVAVRVNAELGAS